VLLASIMLLALTTTGCALFTAGTPLVVIALLLLVSGAARSVSMTGYSTLQLSDVPPAQMRSANVLAGTTQQLFAGLAIAFASVSLRVGKVIGGSLSDVDQARFEYVFAFLALTVVAAIVPCSSCGCIPRPARS
jgi:hypothetical protein